jgi:hypothetical protein
VTDMPHPSDFAPTWPPRGVVIDWLEGGNVRIHGRVIPADELACPECRAFDADHTYIDRGRYQGDTWHASCPTGHRWELPSTRGMT